jgi:hypothetical protein
MQTKLLGNGEKWGLVWTERPRGGGGWPPTQDTLNLRVQLKSRFHTLGNPGSALSPWGILPDRREAEPGISTLKLGKYPCKRAYKMVT